MHRRAIEYGVPDREPIESLNLPSETFLTYRNDWVLVSASDLHRTIRILYDEPAFRTRSQSQVNLGPAT